MIKAPSDVTSLLDQNTLASFQKEKVDGVEFKQLLQHYDQQSEASSEIGESSFEEEDEDIDEEEEDPLKMGIEGISGRDAMRFLFKNPYQNIYINTKDSLKNKVVELAVSLTQQGFNFAEYRLVGARYNLGKKRHFIDISDYCGHYLTPAITYSTAKHVGVNPPSTKNSLLSVEGVIKAKHQEAHWTIYSCFQPQEAANYSGYQVKTVITARSSSAFITNAYFELMGTSLQQYRVFYKKKYYVFSFKDGKLTHYLEDHHART